LANIPTPHSTHIFAVAGTLRVPLSQPQKTSYTAGMFANQPFLNPTTTVYRGKKHLSSVFFKKCVFSSPLTQNCFKKIAHPVENINMQTAELLTPTEMAYALEISEYALQALVHNGMIPHTYIQSPVTQDRLLRFDPYTVTEWLQNSPRLDAFTEKDYVEALKNQYKTRFPQVLTALQTVNAQFAPPYKAKGYNLTKVKSKKYGFLYYVRYIESGKLIPSRWNTRTNNLEAAERFARDNRERILVAYHKKHDTRDKMYEVLENYYKQNSHYIDSIKKRGRRLCEQVRGQYHNFVKKVLIPFLRERHIKCFNEISAPVIAKLQNKLLGDNLKPQTINRYMIGVRTIFDHMVRDGYMAENVLKCVDSLVPQPDDQKVTGCYEVGKPDGVFNKVWKQDEVSYLLNLVIYSSGISNKEMLNIRPKDFIKMGKCNLVDIKEGKTENRVRLAPIHEFVYEKLIAWAKKKSIKDGEPIFDIKPYAFTKAYISLGKKLGFDKTKLTAENIVFYSGRHYWKTLLNANDLGDIEEYFMGHKVSKDVAELYNHRDKQGRARMLAKAREMFRILDKTLFKGRLTT
jgi:integrase